MKPTHTHKTVRGRPPSKISVVPADRTKPYHKGTLFLEGIPLSTKKAFKAACALRQPSETMRDAMLRLMRFYIKKAGKIPVCEADGTEIPVELQ